MKKLKLFSMIVAATMFVACGPTVDPTTIKFTSADEVSVAVGGELNFDVTVQVKNGVGTTTFEFKDLPSWVSKTEATNKVTLKGTAPDVVEDFSVTINATNNKETTTQNFKIKVGGSAPEGNGTKENPYNVAGAIAHQVGAGKWVQGFIVGYIRVPASGPAEWVFSAEGCDGTENTNTNLILAGSASETNKEKCIPVQLPSGAIRNGLNLMDHPTLVGEEVLMYGSLEAYFSVPGLKSVTYAKLIASGTSFGTPPDNDPTDPDPVASLFEDFEGFTSGNSNVYFSAQTDNKGWFGYSTQGTLQPDIRLFNANQYVQFSAHRSSGVTAGDTQEMWAVSPKLDVTAATNKKLNFDIAGGYYNAATIFEVYVLTDKNPVTATKTKLTVTLPTAPTTGYGTLAPIGNIDLSSFSGTIRIGFYYKGTSGSGNSTTWQIDNFSFN